MAITDLRLQNFRSYSDESFEFSGSVNIIVGPNASGKTNLLEAILVLARGSSYRAKDAELVSFNQDWARLETHTSHGSRTVKILTKPLSKSYEIDGKAYKRLSLQASLPVVLFEPNHLLMLSGAPEIRRNYIDDLLEQTTPGYGELRRHYKRVLSQRNSLLKKGFAAAKHQAFVWNLRLSELGGKMAAARTEIIGHINQNITETYQNLSGSKTTVDLKYQSPYEPAHYETSLLKSLEDKLERDCLLGFTSVGPHRDDIKILLDKNPLDEVASRGEARSTVLALKIIELKQLEQARGAAPLLLLDDVFSELDGKRRQALTTFLQPYQTFITTTDADAVIDHFTTQSNIIPLTF